MKMLRNSDGSEVPEWRVTLFATIVGVSLVVGFALAVFSMGITYNP